MMLEGMVVKGFVVMDEAMMLMPTNSKSGACRPC